MVYECKPRLGVTVTLAFSYEELVKLNLMASYGLAVVEPIVGKRPEAPVARDWETFLAALRSATGTPLTAYDAASSVFTGEKVATRRREEQPGDTE